MSLINISVITQNTKSYREFYEIASAGNRCKIPVDNPVFW